MKNTKIIVCIAAAFCLSLAGCTGPGKFNDSQKVVLRQVQVIKLDVQEISAANSETGGMSKQEIVELIKGKIRAAGLTVADTGQDYDASLLVTFGFFKMQFFGQLPPGETKDSIYMNFELNFRHKKMGRIFRTGMWNVPPPHKANFEVHDNIRTLDDALLRHLAKK